MEAAARVALMNCAALYRCFVIQPPLVDINGGNTVVEKKHVSVSRRTIQQQDKLNTAALMKVGFLAGLMD